MLKKAIFVLYYIFSIWSVSAQRVGWINGFGGADLEYSGGLVVDQSKNTYTTGTFRSTVDFDPSNGVFNIQSSGNDDVFISKFGPNGNWIWTKSFGSNRQESFGKVKIDANGNVLLFGVFQDSIDLDPGIGVQIEYSTGFESTFLVKLDSNGNFIWGKTLNSTVRSIAKDVAFDNLGNIVMVGYFEGLGDFDPSTLSFNLTSFGLSDGFLLKLNSNGSFLWAKQQGGLHQDQVTSVVTDTYGNCFISGYYIDSINLDPIASSFSLLGSRFKYSVFFSKFSSNSRFLWGYNLPGADARLTSIDSLGHLVCYGYFNGTYDFNPGAPVFNMTSTGNWDSYFLKMDTAANFIWVKRVGGTANVFPLSGTVDLRGNTYYTGFFNNSVDFDPSQSVYSLSSAGNNDIFLLKLDSSGNFVFANKFGSIFDDYGESIFVDKSYSIYLNGEFASIVDFDPSPNVLNLTSNGNYDVFVEKFNQCSNSSRSVSISACQNYISPSRKYIWTNSGTYFDTIQNLAGCDSIITVQLTVKKVDTSVTQISNILISNANNATYQWLDCSRNYRPVLNANSQTFTPISNGLYAVSVTQNNCTDTSSCFSVTKVSANEINLSNFLTAYPNPTYGNVDLIIPPDLKNVEVSIYNTLGQKIQFIGNVNVPNVEIQLPNISGVYIVVVKSENARGFLKVIKE